MPNVADTAFAIARVRAEEAEQSDPLFRDPLAARFNPTGDVIDATERFLSLPFFRDGIRLRTRFIDDFVRDAVADGLEDFVILGAGFDTRAQRMPELTGKRVYEVDFVEQLAKKRAILGAAPANVFDIGCDFNATGFDVALSDALRARGLHAPSLFIWEGVIGYIGLDVIDRTLALMARLGGRAVFNYGTAIFDPSTAAQHVRRAGFAEFTEHGFDSLWRRYLRGEPHPAASYVLMGVASGESDPRLSRRS